MAGKLAPQLERRLGVEITKNKNRRLYLVIFGYIYRNLVKLRLKLAPIFGLGGCCAFFGVFFGGGQLKVAKPPGRNAAVMEISTISGLGRLRRRVGATRHPGQVQRGKAAFAPSVFPAVPKNAVHSLRSISQCLLGVASPFFVFLT